MDASIRRFTREGELSPRYACPAEPACDVTSSRRDVVAEHAHNVHGIDVEPGRRGVRPKKTPDVVDLVAGALRSPLSGKR